MLSFFFSLSWFGGSLPHLWGPAAEGEGASGLCLKPECAGPFSLGLTESLEAGGWQERVHGEATFSRRLAQY